MLNISRLRLSNPPDSRYDLYLLMAVWIWSKDSIPNNPISCLGGNYINNDLIKQVVPVSIHNMKAGSIVKSHAIADVEALIVDPKILLHLGFGPCGLGLIDRDPENIFMVTNQAEKMQLAYDNIEPFGCASADVNGYIGVPPGAYISIVTMSKNDGQGIIIWKEFLRA